MRATHIRSCGMHVLIGSVLSTQREYDAISYPGTLKEMSLPQRAVLLRRSYWLPRLYYTFAASQRKEQVLRRALCAHHLHVLAFLQFPRQSGQSYCIAPLFTRLRMTESGSVAVKKSTSNQSSVREGKTCADAHAALATNVLTQ